MIKVQKQSLQKINIRIKEHGLRKKIEELCLDQLEIVVFTRQISTVLQACQRLEYLTLCDCSLISLQYFPLLPQLISLELTHNKLYGQHLEPLSKCNKLYSLVLDENRISDFAWTKYFKRTRLTELSIKRNPITNDLEYRQKIYKQLGVDLEVLDGLDRHGNNKEQSQSSISEEEQSGSESSREEASGEHNEKQDYSEESIEENSIHKKIKGDIPEIAPQQKKPSIQQESE